MKITVDFLGIPDVAGVIGGKSVTVDFTGETVNQLIKHLVERYGRKLADMLLDARGHLDLSYQVLINEESWVAGDERERALKDGDQVHIMMIAAGG